MPERVLPNFKLSPCFFCGTLGDNLTYHCFDGIITVQLFESEDHEIATPKHDATVVIECTGAGCGCLGPIADFTVQFNKNNLMTRADWHTLLELAVAKWNARTIPFIPPELGESTRNPNKFYRAKIGTHPSTRVIIHREDLLVIGANIRFREICESKRYSRGVWEGGVLRGTVDGNMLMIERM